MREEKLSYVDENVNQILDGNSCFQSIQETTVNLNKRGENKGKLLLSIQSSCHVNGTICINGFICVNRIIGIINVNGIICLNGII